MFEVEIRNNEPKGYETAVSLRMPATWSEFHDALQKARIKDGRSCGNELLYVGYDGLQRGMIGRNINLYDLNLLAQRLTALTPEENTGMEALLAMEWSRRRGPVSLEHLINLTYNTDVCCLAPQVSNLQELGAFLYENEMLSKEAMALLDTTEEDSEFRASLLKLLGEQHKEDHGGVFTKRGYAELGGEIRPVYAYQPGETTYFQRSGAPVVLEVRKGFFNDPQYDNDKTAILNLPAIDKGVWQAVEAVEAVSAEECAFHNPKACIGTKITLFPGKRLSLRQEGALVAADRKRSGLLCRLSDREAAPESRTSGRRYFSMISTLLASS
jgi:hypothetical protein